MEEPLRRYGEDNCCYRRKQRRFSSARELDGVIHPESVGQLQFVLWGRYWWNATDTTLVRPLSWFNNAHLSNGWPECFFLTDDRKQTTTTTLCKSFCVLCCVCVSVACVMRGCLRRQGQGCVVSRLPAQAQSGRRGHGVVLKPGRVLLWQIGVSYWGLTQAIDMALAYFSH